MSIFLEGEWIVTVTSGSLSRILLACKTTLVPPLPWFERSSGCGSVCPQKSVQSFVLFSHDSSAKLSWSQDDNDNYNEKHFFSENDVYTVLYNL